LGQWKYQVPHFGEVILSENHSNGGPFLFLVKYDNVDNIFSKFDIILVIFIFWWNLQFKVVMKTRAIFERIMTIGKHIVFLVSLDVPPL